METIAVFSEPGYVAHNAARLEHLASLGLPLDGRSVLELGAGIGCHTQFFIDRKCDVTTTDGRFENVSEIIKRYPNRMAGLFDVEDEPLSRFPPHDIVYCYGLLYHCADWQGVLRNIAAFKPQLLLLETCVSRDGTLGFIRAEDANDPRCGLRGVGCRPARDAVWNMLTLLFPFVYSPLTTPNHCEFPERWDEPGIGELRAVFVASQTELNNPLLASYLPTFQQRYAHPV